MNISRPPLPGAHRRPGAEALRDDPRRQRLARGTSRARPNRHWNNDALHQLDRLSGRDFQVVDTRLAAPPRAARHLGTRGANIPPPRLCTASRARHPADRRDLELLRFAGRAPVRARRPGPGAARRSTPSAADARLRRAERRAGYLRRADLLAGPAGTYRSPRQGLRRDRQRAAARRATRPGQLPPRRRAGLAVAGGAQRGVRADARGDLRAPDALARRPAADDPDAAAARRSGSAASAATGATRLHYPDLLLVDRHGHRRGGRARARPPRDAQRRERILAGYAADRRIDAVVYLVEQPAAGRAIEHVGARGWGSRHLVRVQRVRVGPRDAAPAPRREPADARARGGDPRRGGAVSAGGTAARSSTAVGATAARPRGRPYWMLPLAGAGGRACWLAGRGRALGWRRRAAARGWSPRAGARGRADGRRGRRSRSASTRRPAGACSATASSRLTR